MYGPFTITANANCAVPLYYLWLFQYGAQGGFADVATNLAIAGSGGTLQFVDSSSDSPTSQWCWTTGTCTGAQGSNTSTLQSVGTPSAGWPGSTGSYPINSLGYRIAAAPANATTSLAEYAPVFSLTSVAPFTRTIVVPASSVTRYVYLANLDWNTADDSGSVHVSVIYTPASCSFSGSSSSASSSTGRSSAGVVGDPQFVGLRGQRFQVHGIDGAVYNLISEADTQVNARFAYLSAGHCPIIDGFPDTNCWSHPGSYISQLSFQQRVNGTVHTALLTAGGAKDGFSLVQVDGRAVQVGQTATIGSFSVYRKTAHAVSVTTAHFAFELSSSDRFINQAVALTVPMSQVRGAHGLLGQTHSTKLHSDGAIPFIEGGVDDYTIADDDMLGQDFPYNRFVGAQGEQAAE